MDNKVAIYYRSISFLYNQHHIVLLPQEQLSCSSTSLQPQATLYFNRVEK